MVTALLALLVGVPLISCGAAQHLAPNRPEELTHLVLFLQDGPDGVTSHTWRPAEQVDLEPYRTRARPRSASRPISLVMNQSRDCDQENRECIRQCMSRPLARGFGHITSGGRGRGGKEVYCNEQCTQPYLDCSRLQDAQPQEFSSMEGALDWMKRNRRSLLVGSIVVAAGVTFVVVSAGVGAVILVPAVLLATPDLQTDPSLAEALHEPR